MQETTFCVPTKQLADVEHILEWRMSAAYHSYVNFIAALNDAVKGMKVSAHYPVSEVPRPFVAVAAIYFTVEAPPCRLSLPSCAFWTTWSRPATTRRRCRKPRASETRRSARFSRCWPSEHPHGIVRCCRPR